jgi:hypothetical protein
MACIERIARRSVGQQLEARLARDTTSAVGAWVGLGLGLGLRLGLG